MDIAANAAESAEIGQEIPVKLSYDENDLCDSHLNNVGANITDGAVSVLGVADDEPEISMPYYINDVYFVLADGTTSDVIPQNGNCTVVVEPNATSENVFPASVIVAAYAKDGALLTLKQQKLTDEMITNGICNVQLPELQKEIGTMKIFIWDAVNTLKPLAEAVTLN